MVDPQLAQNQRVFFSEETYRVTSDSPVTNRNWSRKTPAKVAVTEIFNTAVDFELNPAALAASFYHEMPPVIR